MKTVFGLLEFCVRLTAFQVVVHLPVTAIWRSPESISSSKGWWVFERCVETVYLAVGYWFLCRFDKSSRRCTFWAQKFSFSSVVPEVAPTANVALYGWFLAWNSAQNFRTVATVKFWSSFTFWFPTVRSLSHSLVSNCFERILFREVIEKSWQLSIIAAICGSSSFQLLRFHCYHNAPLLLIHVLHSCGRGKGWAISVAWLSLGCFRLGFLLLFAGHLESPKLLDQDPCHEKTVDLSRKRSIRHLIDQFFGEFVVPAQLFLPESPKANKSNKSRIILSVFAIVLVLSAIVTSSVLSF